MNKKPKLPSRSGQAIVEYVLLVAMMTLIFSAVFGVMRVSLYRLWVCELAVRVQSPTGCRDTNSCKQILSQSFGYQPNPNCP